MVSEQLITYIKQNTQAGFSRPDIETALRNAGWADADIAVAFDSVAHAKAPVNTPPQEPISNEQSIANQEVARIQEELRVAQADKHVPGATSETGIIGFIIRTNMASDKQSAQILLGVLVVIALTLVYILFLR